MGAEIASVLKLWNENGSGSRLHVFAKALGAVLREGGHYVILCVDPACGWSGLDGPEKCPRCKGLIKPVRRGECEEMANKPTAAIRDCGSYKSYHITYKGQTMRADAWAAKLGIPVATLTEAIDRGEDITPLVCGPEPSAAAPPKRLDTNGHAHVEVVGEGRGRRYRITFQGKTMGVGAWSSAVGCSRTILLQRLLAGEDVTYLLRGEQRPLGRKRLAGIAPVSTTPALAFKQESVGVAQPDLVVAPGARVSVLPASANAAKVEDPPAVKRVRELLAEIDACDDAIAGLRSRNA